MAQPQAYNNYYYMPMGATWISHVKFTKNCPPRPLKEAIPLHMLKTAKTYEILSYQTGALTN